MENTSFEDILIRSRITLLDMLEERGYNTKPYRKLTAGDIVTLRANLDSPEALRIDVNHKTDPERKAVVHYLLDNIKPRVGSGEITNKLLMPLDDENAGKNPLAGIDPKTTEVIIMYRMADRIVAEKSSADKVMGENTDSYDKAALDAWMRMDPTTKSPLKFRLQFWPIQRLVVNLMHHVAQPKFEILTEDQEKEMMKDKYVKSKTQLPMIKFHNDPVARYLGLVPGQIVKITRPSPTGGEYVTYRVCVP